MFLSSSGIRVLVELVAGCLDVPQFVRHTRSGTQSEILREFGAFESVWFRMQFRWDVTPRHLCRDSITRRRSIISQKNGAPVKVLVM
jgi:hypothetical protein